MSTNSANFFSEQAYVVLYAYAQAGETIQVGDSATALASNILVYAPGTDLEGKPFPADPAFGTDIFDCDTDAPGTGVISTRAEELAGPQPNPGGYVPCEFTAPTTGIYPVIMMPPDSTVNAGNAGTVDAPVQGAGFNIAMWDVTVRDAGDVVHPGRVFGKQYVLATGSSNAASVEVFPYTTTGYEYSVNFFDQGGVNWTLRADDMGIVDARTGKRTFASFACGNDLPTNNTCEFSEAKLAPLDRRYVVFLNRADPLVISGAGGLGETSGYAATPISPASNPLSTAFSGSAGQPGSTDQGSGGTIKIGSPGAMGGLGYTLAIDLNKDGTFGNGNDVVDNADSLSASGSTTYAWNGRDAAGNAPVCGAYPYQIRSTLAEVHFPVTDVENSAGGIQIQRLSLPSDPALGNPLAASYNNHDPYKGGLVVTNNPTPAVTDGISGPGFNSWTEISGNTDSIDTWARLPEVETRGTIQVLCTDLEIEKSTSKQVAPGEQATYTLKVTNKGPGKAENVVASDPLPKGESFVSASNGCVESGGMVSCKIPSLAAGSSQAFEVTVKVAASAECKDLTNTATVTNDVPDTNPGNNSSTVRNCGPRADLMITKDPSSARVAPNGQVMYTLVVKNKGPSDDRNVRVSDPLASGLALESAKPSQGKCSTAGGKVSCHLGFLAAGGSAQVLVTAKVTAQPGGGSSACGNGGTEIKNTADVVGDGFDPNQANNRDDAQICVPAPQPGQYDLAIKKKAKPTRITADGKVTYKVVVRNNGPATAPGVKVKDTFNHRGRVVGVKTTAGTCSKALPMSCSLGDLASGAKATITVVVKPMSTGCKQRNAASVTGEGTDSKPANNLSKVDICVAPRLKIVKTVDRKSIEAGGIAHYTIRVTNLSRKIAAENVRTCDRMPSELAYVSSKPRAKLSKGIPCWIAKKLKGGKSVAYHVTAKALRSASGTERNVATARANGSRGKAISDDASVVVRGTEPKPTPVTG